MQPSQSPSPTARQWPVLVSMEIVALLVVLAVTASARFPLVAGPTGRDSGTYTYAGWAILAGRLPYRDVWVNKPPGILYLDALGLWLGGGEFKGILCLEFAVVSGLLLAQWALLARSCGRAAAAIGAIFAAVWLNHPLYLQTENLSEVYTSLLAGLAFSLIMSTSNRGRVAANLLAGVILGSAFMFKPTAGAAAVACGALSLLADRESPRRCIRRLGALVAGWCLVVLTVGACFACQSALTEFWDVSFAYIGTYLSTPISDPSGTAVHRLVRLTENLHWAMGIGFGTVLCAVGYTLFQWPSPAPGRPLADVALASGVWLLLSLILIAAAGRYYGHHFLDMIPPLAILIAVACHALLESCQDGKRTFVAAVIFAAVLIVGGLQFEQHHRPRMRARLQPRYAYVPALIQYLKDHTPGPGGFFIWGADPSVYFALRSPCPSRFVIFDPFVDPTYVISRRLVSQLISQLERAAPGFIVDASPHPYYHTIAIRPPERMDERAALQRRALQPFFDWVAAHYEPVRNPPVYGPERNIIPIYQRVRPASG